MNASPASAYRADLAKRTEPFGASDDAWLSAASRLHLATGARGKSRQHLIYDSIGIAIDCLGDEHVERAIDRDWDGIASHLDPLLVLIDEAHKAGAFRLAALMLDDLLVAAPRLSPLIRGRIRAMRARLAWKLGRLDEAVERYRFLAAAGRRANLPELVARAHTGLLAVAQLRGNYPEMRVHAGKAAEIADRHRLTSVSRMAHYGLMVSLARERAYERSLIEGWKVMRLSRGDSVFESEILQNLGQLLLEAGHATPARASFAAVVDRGPITRVLLPALGGLALASARSGVEPTMEWAVREVWRAQRSEAPGYELSAALLECASALAMLGRRDEAKRYADAADVIARIGQFHELVYRIEELDLSDRSSPAPVQLRAPGSRVARQIEDLEPERLPDHVVFETAPA